MDSPDTLGSLQSEESFEVQVFKSSYVNWVVVSKIVYFCPDPWGDDQI